MKEVTTSLFLDEVTGIYESLRTYEGVIFRVEEHLERFFESAKKVMA